MPEPSILQRSSLMNRISSRMVPSQLQILDDWVVKKHLGSGTTAEVWLLEHTVLRRHIACKTPRRPADAGILLQEAELASQLSHENLIQPVSTEIDTQLAGGDPGQFTYWEYLAGGSLDELVAAGGQLSLASTVTVVLPLVHVTQYLHDRQIIHGDISPQNIMFDLTGRPVLVDLGSSRATAHHATYTGTPGFMAPEILPKRHQVGGLQAPADVYSIAAVAWYCLTGLPPGSTEHRMPLSTLRPDLDPDIAEVLEAGLHAVAVQRPDLSSLSTAVSQWATPEPVDLYASVGQEYGLILPTREPRQECPSRGLVRKRKIRSSKIDQGSNPSPLTQRAFQHCKLLLFITLGTLIIGSGATLAFHAITDISQSQLSVSEQDTTSIDFQEIVNELVRARSAAWLALEPSQVTSYAIEGSSVYEDDVDLLARLADSGYRLDGLDMEAVVEQVDRKSDSTVVQLVWRIEGFTQRDRAGTVIQTVEPSQEVIVLEIKQTAEGWRMVNRR